MNLHHEKFSRLIDFNLIRIEKVNSMFEILSSFSRGPCLVTTS
jgi:hypothetical protein